MGNSLINGILFQPPELTYLHPSRRLWLKTKNGERISAVYVDQPGATLTVLFSHGNAEDLGMLYGWAHGMSQMLRVNMLLYDYRGYGNSEGERICQLVLWESTVVVMCCSESALLLRLTIDDSGCCKIFGRNAEKHLSFVISSYRFNPFTIPPQK